MKSQELMMGRDFTLRTTKGHTVRFERMVPRMVPSAVVEEAMRYGAFPVNPDKLASIQSETEDAEVAEAARIKDRDSIVKAKIREMMERNHRDDFTAGGLPNVRVIRAETGMDLSADERERFFHEVQRELNGEGE